MSGVFVAGALMRYRKGIWIWIWKVLCFGFGSGSGSGWADFFEGVGMIPPVNDGPPPIEDSSRPGGHRIRDVAHTGPSSQPSHHAAAGHVDDQQVDTQQQDHRHNEHHLHFHFPHLHPHEEEEKRKENVKG